MATRTTDTASARSGGLVRELAPRGAATRPAVNLDVRPAVDFLISLVGDTEPELLPADLEWRAKARASLAVPVARDLERVFGSHDKSHDDELADKEFVGWGFVASLVGRRDVVSSADVLAQAGTITPAAIVVAACDDADLAGMRVLAERFFVGETGVRDELMASTPAHYRAALERLAADPDGEIRALRRILRAWREQFTTIEDRVGAMQERDVAARRPDFERLPLVDAVERATNGIRTSFDARVRLDLVPSYFARPYNYTFDGEDWHLIAYPMSEAAIGGDRGAVPESTVRMFRALGDESRLRILRHLVDGDLYLTEIADRLGISKPTAKHHLAQLRAAGLVTMTEAGNLTYYSLRRERIADAGPDLGRYLGLGHG